ncbi:MAG: molybdate ABC transporter permease subunit [Candidatus Marinimicrobia bacterium]|nr:molybdate ABC transporter permease subunit [Candidatus Neomarinimicrobiota bacterium]
MESAAFSALWISLKAATLSTLIVSIPGTVLAYILARYEFRGKDILSSLVILPLVLPPTAVGYMLLGLLGAGGPLSPDFLGFDLNILFTFKAVVLACTIMATPLVVRTARITFESIEPRLESMAYTLGHGKIRTFFSYTLPLAYRGLLAAMILGFTRAVGEFGATIIVAGNIQGKTRTLASAIFTAQQVMDERQAALLLAISLVVGFLSILASEYLSRKRPGFLTE